jgi:AraC family transcriptional regulator of adaptative response / DNA-3-methyladenine glycosylase II
MNLDPDICYLAMKSRDARFDGRFYAAVVTTGVYCRPICPAPKPHRHNVRFYTCAAAAEEAGFRPCMRCRPEASPGTPAWVGTSATVTRALRLISDGYLDDASVDDLAERLGMGSRHLRRLFVEHLGASPAAVAQTRRVHFAKALLDNTTLPVTDIVFSSGFSSIRRFNATFKKTFGRSPTDARTARQRGRQTVTNGEFELRLTFRPPFDYDGLLEFLRGRVVAGVETVEGNVYRRTVCFEKTTGIIAVRPSKDRDHLLLRIPTELSRHAAEIAERIRRVFDLKADPSEIAAHLGQDRMLAPLVKRFAGMRVPGAWDPFETSIRAVVGQQVTVKAATTIAGRLAERYGEPIDDTGDDALRYLFPTPERLSRARLANIGMPASRTRAVRRLAKAVHSGEIDFNGSTGLEHLVQSLTRLDGIGPWTANYIAMRACSEPDAFPAGDIALQRAAQQRDKRLTSERLLIKRAEAWRPWRAYATICLWNDYANKPRQ